MLQIVRAHDLCHNEATIGARIVVVPHHLHFFCLRRRARQKNKPILSETNPDNLGGAPGNLIAQFGIQQKT